MHNFSDFIRLLGNQKQWNHIESIQLNPLSAKPDKMVKQTQTIRRLTANELFQCVWPFCGIGGLGLKGLTFKRSKKHHKGVILTGFYEMFYQILDFQSTQNCAATTRHEEVQEEKEEVLKKSIIGKLVGKRLKKNGVSYL